MQGKWEMLVFRNPKNERSGNSKFLVFDSLPRQPLILVLASFPLAHLHYFKSHTSMYVLKRNGEREPVRKPELFFPLGTSL